MVSSQPTAGQSWIAIGFILAVVLATQAYEASRPGEPGMDLTAHVITFLGGSRRAVHSGEFRGGEVTTVLGGSELDLRATTIKPGHQIVVDVLAVMGGVTIRVPNDWTVDARAVPVLGDIADRRRPSFDAPDASPPVGLGPAPRLVLRGAVVMGALVIRS